MPRPRKVTKATLRRREKKRLKALLALEEGLWAQGLQHVAGVDEAGRGPLAGPVVAAAVIMPPGVAIKGVDDSKRLTPDVRVALAQEIRATALCIGVGAASAREIDTINILRATHLAMRRALAKLTIVPQHVIVDGLPVTTLGEHTAVVDGDAKVHAIACASIIAKVTRDHLMALLAHRHPGYGWEHNAGYSTPDHRDGIGRLGLTPHHRRSFGFAQLSLELDFLAADMQSLVVVAPVMPEPQSAPVETL